MFLHRKYHLGISFALASAIVTGCGAPTKSAGDVSYIFSDEQTILSLQDKLTNMCATLETRTEYPKFDGLDLATSGCAGAGEVAINVSTAENFYFSGLDDGKEDANDEMSFDVRGQVWLNKSLLGMASALGALLNDKSAEGADADGPVFVPDSGYIDALATPELTQSEVVIDTENLSVSMDLNFKLTGAVEIDLDLQVNGQLVDDGFAITVRSTNDPSYEQSFVKSINVAAVVIPHASDLYMDTWLGLTVYKIGLVDSALKQQLETFLNSGLKTMIDSAMQL